MFLVNWNWLDWSTNFWLPQIDRYPRCHRTVMNFIKYYGNVCLGKIYCSRSWLTFNMLQGVDFIFVLKDPVLNWSYSSWNVSNQFVRYLYKECCQCTLTLIFLQSNEAATPHLSFLLLSVMLCVRKVNKVHLFSIKWLCFSSIWFWVSTP